MKELSTYEDILPMAEDFAAELGAYQSINGLPTEWFVTPDHVAYKCRDAADYDRIIAMMAGHFLRGSYVQMDGRRLASFQLATPLALPHYGQISWLEVMQPRPEKVGHDIVGLEHIEFVYKDFLLAVDVLRAAGIDYELQSNPGHDWLSIIFGVDGRELKLNNRSLADVVQRELADGQATVL